MSVSPNIDENLELTSLIELGKIFNSMGALIREVQLLNARFEESFPTGIEGRDV